MAHPDRAGGRGRPLHRRARAAPRRCGRAAVVSGPGGGLDAAASGLIDHVNSLKLEYLVELAKLGGTGAQLESGVASWLHEHDVIFDGRTIPFVLMPHFVSPGQHERVRTAVDTLCAVLDRFCDAYPRDAALRDELALPEFEDELIRIDPGFPRPMRICRLDALLSGSEVRFLEFNSDSPAGIGYTDVLHEGLAGAIDLPRLEERFDLLYVPILPQVVATLLDAYGHVRARRPDLPETPRLAVVDSAGSPSVPEFRIVCAAARSAGLEAVHATLEEVAYDGTTLTVAGEPAHLVYRRCLLDDLTTDDLPSAARDGSIALVNPFRSRVANNKKLLALFDDPRFAHLVTPDEARVVRRTVPWTRILRPGRVARDGWTVDLLPFVADNRERLVLKPSADYGGHGVALGLETGEDEWQAIVAEHAERADFIVQEYVPVPQELFPTVEDGRVELRLKQVNVNPFGIGGRHAGSIARISDRAVINVSAGGGLLPSVIGRDRAGLHAAQDEEEATHDPS